jgi:hypothetical protein
MYERITVNTLTDDPRGVVHRLAGGAIRRV